MTKSDSKPPTSASGIELITNRELTGGETPTPPSLLWPGTPEAIERQCSCPREENMRRLKDGAAPKLKRDCRVHNKICQALPCGHTDHINFHPRCEHCTNVLHICVVCEAVYLEDGDDPSLFGWVYTESDPLVKGWKCWRCK